MILNYDYEVEKQAHPYNFESPGCRCRKCGELVNCEHGGDDHEISVCGYCAS